MSEGLQLHPETVEFPCGTPGGADDVAPATSAGSAPRSRRLLRRLERRLEAAESRRAADRLRCELAAGLARCGDLDGARRAYADMRDRHAAAPRPSLATSVSLHITEALIAHASRRPAEAHDRFSRAYALSSAASLAAPQAVCAAWLAQIELRRGQPASAARYAGEALVLAAADDHPALARAHLVVAQAYHAAGHPDKARTRYDAARRHALAADEGGTLSDILQVQAQRRLAGWRQGRAEGDATAVDPTIATTVLVGAESSANLDALLGLDVPAWQHPILRAQILVEAGSGDERLALHAEALAIFERHLAAAIESDLDDHEGTLLADHAWCLWRSGRNEASRVCAEDASAALSKPGAAGDRAPGHARLVQVFDGLGDATQAEAQRTHAARARALHRRDQTTTAAAFDAALDATVIV